MSGDSSPPPEDSRTWFSILRCPYCRGAFRLRNAQKPAWAAADFGVLQCGCCAFPVVDGVPILQRDRIGMFEHTTGAAQVSGVAVSKLVNLIEAGQPLDALVECTLVPALPGWARRIPGHRRRPARGLARQLGKRRFCRRVLSRRQALGAYDLFTFFYRTGSPLGTELGWYFLYRFGQPRYLAALALLSHLPAADKPVLDLGCGAGHLEHYLTRRSAASAAIGIDMNFFQIWIAQHWMAPAARFVCCNVEEGLPFADDAFSGAVCSDAYHYFRSRRAVQREIARCAPGRPVVLTRVGNKSVMPNEGAEASVADYLGEFGAKGVQAFDETELVECYLDGTNPLERTRASLNGLARAKWLSFAWKIPETQSAGAAADIWPHAVGDIGVNPIYARSVSPQGDLNLRFDFPSRWFAYENAQMLAYHPRTAVITRDQMRRLGSWRHDPAQSALVRSFVLVGLPRRFDRRTAAAARAR